MELFRNGKKRTATPTDTGVTGPQAGKQYKYAFVGLGQGSGGSRTVNFWHGRVADVRTYGRALVEAELPDLMEEGRPGAQAGGGGGGGGGGGDDDASVDTASTGDNYASDHMAGTMAVQATVSVAEDAFGGEEFTRKSAESSGVSMSTNSTGEGEGKEVNSVFNFAYKWTNSSARTSVHYSGGHPLTGFETADRPT